MRFSASLLKSKFRLVFAIFFGLLIFSCSKKNDKIVFDDSEPLSLSPQTEWILVTSPYAPIYADTTFESVVVTHSRRGEILRVLGKRTTKLDEQTIKWIAVEEGWIVSSEFELFPNKLRAEKASRKFVSDLDS